MINDLRYAVTFPTNQVGLSGALTFQPGSTAISGRNGTGKSFIAEMIRYGLFGKKALRGPASDYKSLDMSLGFLDYRVERGKKEQLFDPSDEVIAVGADAVNKKIVEILGFGLEVFDVVCSANQKESERLTRLQPAKRKELIDDVVGLTAQEVIEKACREEAKLARVEAEALTRALSLPEEPVKPEGYRPSAELRDELLATKELEDCRARLLTIVNSVGEAPVEPEKECPDLEEIEAHELERTRQEFRCEAIERQINGIAPALYTAEQLDEVEAFHARTAELSKLGSKPEIDLMSIELKEMLDTWDTIDMLTRLGGVEVNCPNCQHPFCPSQELPEPPGIYRAEIKAELSARTRWANAPAELPMPELALKLLSSDISRARLALDRVTEKQLLVDELATIKPMVDRSAELTEARRLDRDWEIYVRETETHMTRVAASNEAQAELGQMEPPVNSVAELDALFVAARVWETQQANYTEQKARFDTLTQEIAEKQSRSEAFISGAKGLVEARRTLKAFLAPSLSRVASKIISQMTSSALHPLHEIHVDEDMNITVDGQDACTFNGAHATMINLALRLALGQVLVARVFPLFIGDEIDSDADEANSQMIADAIMACKDQLKQIVLISHKRLENVDHEVML